MIQPERELIDFTFDRLVEVSKQHRVELGELAAYMRIKGCRINDSQLNGYLLKRFEGHPVIKYSRPSGVTIWKGLRIRHEHRSKPMSEDVEPAAFFSCVPPQGTPLSPLE